MIGGVFLATIWMGLLFTIYRFYTNSEMDLDEDIPGLLVGNTTIRGTTGHRGLGTRCGR